jgi:hypothetical protein
MLSVRGVYENGEIKFKEKVSITRKKLAWHVNLSSCGSFPFVLNNNFRIRILSRNRESLFF